MDLDSRGLTVIATVTSATSTAASSWGDLFEIAIGLTCREIELVRQELRSLVWGNVPLEKAMPSVQLPCPLLLLLVYV